jgi:hypothetical protein
MLYAYLISRMHATCPYPSHPPWFDHANNIWWRVQIVEHIIMRFLQTSVKFQLKVQFMTMTIWNQAVRIAKKNFQLLHNFSCWGHICSNNAQSQ